MANKRNAPRQRVLKSGTITVGGASIDCTRNLSEAGAALQVASVVGIPTEFALCIHSDPQMSRRVAEIEPDRSRLQQQRPLGAKLKEEFGQGA